MQVVRKKGISEGETLRRVRSYLKSVDERDSFEAALSLDNTIKSNLARFSDVLEAREIATAEAGAQKAQQNVAAGAGKRLRENSGEKDEETGKADKSSKKQKKSSSKE